MRRILVLVLVLGCACATGAQPTPSTLAVTSPPDATAPPSASPTAEVLAPRSAFPTAPPNATAAHVTRVVDGDTVILAGINVGRRDRSTPGRYARLIGIDTPEVYGGVDCFGREASAFTKRVLSGKNVRVTFDLDPIDRYNRALVYVWEESGAFFNARLVAEGYALQATFPPNVRYVDLFRELVTQAREANRGLWRGCS